MTRASNLGREARFQGGCLSHLYYRQCHSPPPGVPLRKHSAFQSNKGSSFRLRCPACFVQAERLGNLLMGHHGRFRHSKLRLPIHSFGLIDISPSVPAAIHGVHFPSYIDALSAVLLGFLKQLSGHSSRLWRTIEYEIAIHCTRLCLNRRIACSCSGREATIPAG